MDLREQLNVAINTLVSGNVVGMPTETVYGLAARISEESAIRRVFELKDRPLFDPLIVHVSSIEMAKPLVGLWTNLMDKLAEEFWPGPLTMIVPKEPDMVSSLITAGLPDVGIRMPNHELALELISAVGEPLAAPSANLFGRTSPTTSAHVRSFFPDLPVLDGGECAVGIESTVLRVIEKEGPQAPEISILRRGAITVEDIKNFLKKHELNATISFGEGKNASPGQETVHYRMKSPLFLIGPGMSRDAVIAALHSKGYKSDFRELLFNVTDPLIVARQLYARMHRISELSHGDPVIFQLKREMDGELWEAIIDRLRRASTEILN